MRKTTYFMSIAAPELNKLTRNPAVKLVDYREHDVATDFKQHKLTADTVANGLRAGDLFTLAQRSGKGFWVSEWTVGGAGDKKHAVRRRAGDGKTIEAAIDAMMSHPSRHNSHYYRPEESFLKMLKRVLFSA